MKNLFLVLMFTMFVAGCSSTPSEAPVTETPPVTDTVTTPEVTSPPMDDYSEKKSKRKKVVNREYEK